MEKKYRANEYTYDCFLSHASEDKAEIVEPLVAELRGRGLRVWFDADEIRIGDSFRKAMEAGLGKSRFGVVVVSPSFVGKYWPEQELDALYSQESVLREKRVLPVIHGMTHKELVVAQPFLASRAVAFSHEGVDAVAGKIVQAMREEGVKAGRKGSSALHGVPPPRSVHFVGRDRALLRLKERLQKEDAVSVSASIEGLAGIGKTELALQLVHQLAAEGAFPGGIYWFDAENPDLTTAWGTEIAEELGIEEGPVEQRASLAVKAVRGRKRSVLLVLDNVEAWTRDSQPGPLPVGAHLRLLVTTRRSKLGGSAFEHLELGILEEPYDRELLQEVAGRDLSAKAGYGALLEYLGGHALALELAGVYFSVYLGKSPAEYLEALLEGEDPEAKVGGTDLLRYERTMRQTFGVLEGGLEKEVRQAWRLGACFEPEWVSLALSEAVGLDEDALRGLRRWHLVESDSEGRWRMHRLTREYGRGMGSEEELLKARRAFVEGCGEYCFEKIDLPTGAMTYLPDRMHLDRALEQAEGLWGEKDERLPRFLDDIATALQSAAEYSKSEPLFRRALALHEEYRGKEDSAVAVRLNNLAQLLKATNRLDEAEPLMRRALAIDESCYGEDHPNVATHLNNLAQLLQATNRLDEAEPLMRRALAIDESSYGEDHPRVARDLNNLANLLRETNRLEEAEPLMRRALGIDESSYGEDHPQVAIGLSGLGLLMMATNRLDEAEPLMRRALAICEASLVEGHPWTEAARRNLELLLKAMAKAGIEPAGE